MNETDATRQRSVQEAIDTIPDGLSQRRKSNGSEPRHEARDESVVRTDDEDTGRTRQPRREDRDESTARVDDESLEMSLEMSQQHELATGARGSDARSCCDSARKTPPIR